MWPFRKKVVKTPKPKPNMFHGYDLNEWNYLGLTQIKFDSVPNTIFFLQKKGKDDVRAYTLSGRPDAILKTIAKLHSYVHETCELWRIKEYELYTPIREPSKFLKEHMFSEKGFVWSTEKEWWVPASDKDRYDHSVATHRKETPKIISDNNVLTVNFKDRNL